MSDNTTEDTPNTALIAAALLASQQSMTLNDVRNEYRIENVQNVNDFNVISETNARQRDEFIDNSESTSINQFEVNIASRLDTAAELRNLGQLDEATALENEIRTEQTEFDPRTGFDVDAVTQNFASTLDNILGGFQNSTRDEMKRSINRMSDLMADIDNSSAQEKDFLLQQFESSRMMMIKESDRRFNIASRATESLLNITSRTLDISSLYAGFVDNNPAMMMLFGVASTLVKRANDNRKFENEVRNQDRVNLQAAIDEEEFRVQEPIDSRQPQSIVPDVTPQIVQPQDDIFSLFDAVDEDGDAVTFTQTNFDEPEETFAPEARSDSIVQEQADLLFRRDSNETADAADDDRNESNSRLGSIESAILNQNEDDGDRIGNLGLLALSRLGGIIAASGALVVSGIGLLGSGLMGALGLVSGGIMKLVAMSGLGGGGSLGKAAKFIGGAGLAAGGGFLIGKAINDNLLSDDTKETIGNVVGTTVDTIASFFGNEEAAQRLGNITNPNTFSMVDIELPKAEMDAMIRLEEGIQNKDEIQNEQQNTNNNTVIVNPTSQPQTPQMVDMAITRGQSARDSDSSIQRQIDRNIALGQA